jgi:CubicO group peptidase (beta-lactamase class C family)
MANLMTSRRAFIAGLAGSALPAWSPTFALEMPAAAPEAVGLSSARLAELDAKLQDYVESGRRAGIVGLIARRGKIAYHKAFGWADIARKTPMKTDAIMRMASMTKPITCTAAMMLFEQGKFRLDDPIEKYIPEFGNVKVFGARDPYGEMYLVPPKRKPTILDLFRHTAGLTYGDFRDEGLRQRWAKENIMALGQVEFARALATYPLDYQPAEKWFYSVSTDLLASLVEIWSGVSLADYSQSRIFQPLDMRSSGIGPIPDHVKSRVPVLYNKDASGILSDPATGAQDDWSGRGVVGGSGMWSTARDYCRFSQLMLNRGILDGVRLLKPETVDAMSRNQLPAGVNVDPYPAYKFGLGMAVAENPSLPWGFGAVGQYGWGGSNGTYFGVDPKQELITIWMTQGRPHDHPARMDFLTLASKAVIS